MRVTIKHSTHFELSDISSFRIAVLSGYIEFFIQIIHCRCDETYKLRGDSFSVFFCVTDVHQKLLDYSSKSGNFVASDITDSAPNATMNLSYAMPSKVTDEICSLARALIESSRLIRLKHID